jgi:hypothetical protein
MEGGIDLEKVELGMLCPQLADHPRRTWQPASRRVRRGFLRCFFRSLELGVFLLKEVCRTILPGVAGLSAGKVRTVRISWCDTGCLGSVFGLSTVTLRTIRLAPADCPLGHLGPSVPGTAVTSLMFLIIISVSNEA